MSSTRRQGWRIAPRPIGTVLPPLLRRLEPDSLLAQVQAVWPQVAGPAVGAEAEPVSERGGTVTVCCRSSVWAAELSLLSPDLLAGLAAALADRHATATPRALRFVVGAS